jgi:methylase of polypeptide subunit release factors
MNKALFLSAGATIDALTLAQVVSTRMSNGLLVDVGCGNGLVGICVAIQRPEINVLAVDVSYSACLGAKRWASGLAATVSVTCCDLTSLPIEGADAFCCNPPLVPGELGFTLHSSNEPIPFWICLVEQAKRLGVPRVFVHLYDFHGVEQRTGDWPSAEEIAQKHGYKISYLYRGVRYVGLASSIRRSLALIGSYFPRGIVYIDESAIRADELRHLVDPRNLPENIKIPHTVALFWT